MRKVALVASIAALLAALLPLSGPGTPGIAHNRPTTVTQTVTQTITQTVTQTVTVTASPTTTTPPPTGCMGVDVVAPASIQAAVNAAPTGATLCLSGTFTGQWDIRPKDGQTLQGPAVIVGPFDVPDKTIAEPDDIGIRLRPQDADNVTVVDLDVSGFEDGLECWTDVQVLGGRYHHNTSNGMGCGLNGGGPVLFEGVEVDNNGSAHFVGNSSGGIKIARSGSPGVVARDMHIHDNIGNGYWCDVQCRDFEIYDSLVTDNTRKGVFYEKSGADDETILGVEQQGRMIVRGNTFLRNGLSFEGFANGGIGIVSSKHVLIENNVTDGNWKGGVTIWQDGRTSGEKHGWFISDIVIRNNDIRDGIAIVGDSTPGCGTPQVTCSGNV